MTNQTSKPAPLILNPGFLGAGKTTFLQNLATELLARNVVALVGLNDFENVDVDARAGRAPVDRERQSRQRQLRVLRFGRHAAGHVGKPAARSTPCRQCRNQRHDRSAATTLNANMRSAQPVVSVEVTRHSAAGRGLRVWGVAGFIAAGRAARQRRDPTCVRARAALLLSTCGDQNELESVSVA